MRKWVLIMESLLCLAGPAFAFDEWVYRNADVVPTFSHSLIFGGSNLRLNVVDLDLVGDDLSLDLDIHGYYDLAFQHPSWDIHANNYLGLSASTGRASNYDDYLSSYFPSAGDSLSAHESLSVNVRRYFLGDTRLPLSVLAGGAFRLDVEDPSYVTDLDAMSGSVAWRSGVGLGRTVNVTPVARAVAVALKLDLNLSNEETLEAARIIAQQDEYRFRFRGEYEEHFYGDLAAAMGLPDRVMTVRRALLDSAWISPRVIGWSVIAEYYQRYLVGAVTFGEQRLRTPYLYVRVDLGVPIGLRAQFSPSIRYSVPFSDFRSPEALFDAYVYLDHSTNWRSYVGATGVATFLYGYDPSMELSLVAGTGAGFLERLHWNLRVEYTLAAGQADNLNTAFDFEFRPDLGPSGTFTGTDIPRREPRPRPPAPKPEELGILANDPVKVLTGVSVAFQQRMEETNDVGLSNRPAAFGGGAYGGVLIRTGYYLSIGLTTEANLYAGPPVFSVAPQLMLMVHPPRRDVTLVLGSGVAVVSNQVPPDVTVGLCVGRHLFSTSWIIGINGTGHGAALRYAYVW